MQYQPLSSLQSLYNNKMSTLPNQLNTNPNQSLVNSGIPNFSNSRTANMGLSVGTKTQSPTDNIQTPSNTTTQPKITSNTSSTKNTSGGTTGFSLATLAQQKQLNSQGAGLKEDGIMGPLTQSAISNPKYSNNTSTNTQTTATTVPTASPTPSPYTVNNGLYGQLVTGIANQGGSQYNQNIQNAGQGLTNTAQTNPGTSGKAYDDYQKSVDNLNQLKAKMATTFGNIESSGIPLDFQQGREQVLARQYASQLDAAQQAVNQAQAALGYQIQGTQTQQAGYQQAGQLGQAGQTLAQGALGTAIGAAQPQLGAIGSQQYYNPVTAGNLGNETVQLTGAPAQDISNLSQAVINGTMSYDAALSQLNGYGTAIQNQLLPSIQKQNPNFNVAQSNTLASQQGSITPAYNFAKSALTNVQNIIKQLGPTQNTNVPIVNSISNWLSTNSGVGSDITRQYAGAIQEARNAYAQLLAASKGGTPTEYGTQANTAIPDNATPNDIQAALNNLESLGGSKVNIYGNPGAVGNTSGGTTSETNNTISTSYGAINPNL